MKKQDHVTVSFDEASFNKTMSSVKEDLNKLNALYEEFAKLDLFKIKSIEELILLAKNGVSYVKERIGEQIDPPKWGVFKLKKSVAVDMLELPDMTKLNHLSSLCDTKFHSRGYYQLVSNKIVMKEGLEEEIKESHSLIAKDQSLLKMVDAHKRAAEALQEFNDYSKEVFGNPILRRDSSFNTYFAFLEPGEIKVSDYFYQLNRSVFYKK